MKNHGAFAGGVLFIELSRNTARTAGRRQGTRPPLGDDNPPSAHARGALFGGVHKPSVLPVGSEVAAEPVHQENDQPDFLASALRSGNGRRASAPLLGISPVRISPFRIRPSTSWQAGS